MESEKEIVFFRHFPKLYNNKYRRDREKKAIVIDKKINKMHDSPIDRDIVFKKYDFSSDNQDIIYVSPYRRTRETYEYLFGVNNNYFIDSRIREYLGNKANLGNRLDVDEVTKEYVKDIPGEETEHEFEERCFSFFEEIMKNQHKKIFVITHGFVINKFFR